MADEILGHTTEEWQPMPPNMGPPLPRFLDIYWPWYKPPTAPTVYTCPYCGATFSTQEELNQHILTEHPEAPPVTYTCPVCGAVFSTEAELNYHIQTVHPTAPPVGEAQFEYASDIRFTHAPTSSPYDKHKIDVDIKNIGTASGVCNVYKPSSTAITLNVGQVATYHYEWFQGLYEAVIPNVFSSAGLINGYMGVVNFSLDIPPQIASGSEFWGAISIYLKNVSHIVYDINVYLTGTGGVYGQIPVVSGAIVCDPAYTSGAQASAAGYDPEGNIALNGSRFYTISGIYSRAWRDSHHIWINSPATATVGQFLRKERLPAPPGIYQIGVKLKIGWWVESGYATGPPYSGWEIPKDYPIDLGQVEII